MCGVVLIVLNAELDCFVFIVLQMITLTFARQQGWMISSVEPAQALNFSAHEY